MSSWRTVGGFRGWRLLLASVVGVGHRRCCWRKLLADIAGVFCWHIGVGVRSRCAFPVCFAAVWFGVRARCWRGVS